MLTTEEQAPTRSYKGVMRFLVTILLIAIPVWGLLYLFDLHIYLGISFTLAQYLGFFIALIMSLTFLLFPATKGSPRNKLPWYDVLFAILGLLVGIYLTLYHPDIVRRHYVVTRLELTLGVITILLLLESARRTTGVVLPIMGVVFIFYALFTNFFPGMFQGRGYSWDRVVPYLYFTESGILGVPLHMAGTIVLAYILFGEVLQLTGGGKLIIDLSLALVGRFRGGPAKVAVIASALFGTMSGSPGANVVVTGTFTIPMMKKIGYKPYYAGAVEAVASTGGIIMPPVMGAAAFLMAEFLGIPYAKVAIAAFLPALLYYIGVFCQVDFEAAKMQMKGLSPEEVSPVRQTLKKGWLIFLPLAVLIYFLLIARITPTTSALYATASAILVSLFYKEERFSPAKVVAMLKNTGQGLITIGIICAFVGIIIGSMYLTGLGVNLSIVLTSVAGGNIAILLILAAITSVILGMGMPAIPCYATLAILVGPALSNLGADLIGAHLFLLYFGAMSFITPPVAPAAITAAGLARASYMKTGWQACRLGIVAYLAPFVFVFNPTLLMKGPIAEIANVFVTAALGVVLLAAALEGYLFSPFKWWDRAMLLIGGIGLFIPGWKTDIIGFAVIVYILFKERRALGRFYQGFVQRRHPMLAAPLEGSSNPELSTRDSGTRKR